MFFHRCICRRLVKRRANALIKLGGKNVFLAKPEKVVSEDRKAVLDVDKNCWS